MDFSYLLKITYVISLCFIFAKAFNGELSTQNCPNDCECHYFRINWVTDCSHSNLSEIPYSELSLNVYILNMNENIVVDVRPFPPGIKVRRLQMAHNMLTTIRRQSYAGLKYLLDADFSNNYITAVEPDSFIDSPGLITLELQGNILSRVEDIFLVAPLLMYLDMSDCNVTYLNSNFFSMMAALNTLILSHNNLKNIEENALKPLKSLHILKMKNCSLTSVDAKLFSAQSELQILELSGNQLKEVAWNALFTFLTHLEHLDLRNSYITHLPENTFVNNKWITSLILAENELRHLDVATTLGHNLHYLSTLDLSACKLKGALFKDAFFNASNLKVLSLSGNILLSSDIDVAVASLHNLERLLLSNCSLQYLPNYLHSFTYLKELDISYNPITNIFTSLQKPLRRLEYLNMAYSNITYISPDAFSKMTSLKHLVLSGNPLKYLEEGVFQNLTHLEILELNHCGLRKPIQANVFSIHVAVSDIFQLVLSENPIDIPNEGPVFPKQLCNLRFLDMSYCNISYLPEEAFYWARNITTLKLVGNLLGLTKSNLNFLKLLSELEELDLRYNHFINFSPHLIENNPKLNLLKLIGNPWKCDCGITKLWHWAQLEKHDLGVLEGSISIGSEMKTGGLKKRIGLTCTDDTSLNQLYSINSSSLLKTNNRTWAKYVRDKSCAFIPELIKYNKVINIETQVSLSKVSHEKNTWIRSGIIVTKLYIVFIIFLIIFSWSKKTAEKYLM